MALWLGMVKKRFCVSVPRGMGPSLELLPWCNCCEKQQEWSIVTCWFSWLFFFFIIEV